MINQRRAHALQKRKPTFKRWVFLYLNFITTPKCDILAYNSLALSLFG
jgi:hypothetical protein